MQKERWIRGNYRDSPAIAGDCGELFTATMTTTNPKTPFNLSYRSGHQPGFVLPSEMQYQLSQSAQRLQTYYPHQNLNEIQAALETWLIAAIEDLATNAEWHCHSARASFAIARLSFQAVLQNYREVERID